MYPCKQCQYISISAIVCIRTNNFAHRCSLTVGAGKFCRFGNFFWWANFPRRPWNPKTGELRREERERQTSSSSVVSQSVGRRFFCPKWIISLRSQKWHFPRTSLWLTSRKRMVTGTVSIMVGLPTQQALGMVRCYRVDSRHPGKYVDKVL